MRLALGGWLAAVLVLTLMPNPGRGQAVNLQPGADLTYDRGLLNLLANTILFLPLGLFIAAARSAATKWWAVVLVAVALSCAIELAQYYGETGRQADVNDVITNGLGAVVGFALAATLRSARQR